MTDSQRKLFAAISDLISRSSAHAEASLLADRYEIEPGAEGVATQELRRVLHGRVSEGPVRRFVEAACVRLIHDLFVTMDGGSHDLRMLIVDGDTGEDIGIANNEHFIEYMLNTELGPTSEQ